MATVLYVDRARGNQNDQRAVNTLPLSDLTIGRQLREEPNRDLYRIILVVGDYLTMRTPGAFELPDSLQTALRMENKHGLTAQFAYTWAHQIDEETDDLSSISDPFNVRYDRGPGGYDRRHTFNGKPYLQHSVLHACQQHGGAERAGWLGHLRCYHAGDRPAAERYLGWSGHAGSGRGTTTVPI